MEKIKLEMAAAGEDHQGESLAQLTVSADVDQMGKHIDAVVSELLSVGMQLRLMVVVVLSGKHSQAQSQ